MNRELTPDHIDPVHRFEDARSKEDKAAERILPGNRGAAACAGDPDLLLRTPHRISAVRTHDAEWIEVVILRDPVVGHTPVGVNP